MGNSQSEISDDEDKPSYDYHKKVLQEAENDTSLKLISPSQEEEQYFTGDEGDSVRSITPPRNRPESSSSEEFSDSDTSEDDEGSISNSEKLSGVKKTISNLNTSVAKNVHTKKSCGQCNVSTFQEHDSIGPELEAARRSGRKSKNSSQIHNTSASPVNDSMASSNQTSPFKPITSIISTSHDNSYTRESPDSKSVTQKATAHGKGKRKRLGYFDSSDSEENEKLEKLVNERRNDSKKSQVKFKSSFSSSKKSTSIQKNLQQHVQDSDTNSEPSDSERTLRYRNRRMSPDRINLKSNRSGKHTQHDLASLEGNAVSEMNTNSCAAINPGLVDATHGNKVYDETYNSVPSSNVLRKGETFLSSKMGNRCIRNPLGKVVPTGHTLQPSVANVNSQNTTEVSRQYAVLEPSNQKTVINAQNSAFVLTQALGNRGPYPPEHKETVETVDRINTSTPNTAKQCEDDGLEPTSSPFKNVVLTPTKRTRNNNSARPVGESNTAGSNSLDRVPMNDEDVMEVDDKNDLSTRSPGYQAHNSNSVSTAENFKRFWSEKKRNISSNLKSFFSKSLSPSSKQDLSGRNQTPFFSPSPSPVRFKGATPVLKSPQNTITTYLSSDKKHRSFVSSSPQQDRLQYPYGTAATTSFQNASFSLQQVSPIIANRAYQNTTEHISNQSLSNSICQSESRRLSPASRANISSSFHNTNYETPEKITIDILPNSSPNEVLNFQLVNYITVGIKVGDLSEQPTGGIVNWTDGGLTHTVTTCSQRIAAKAGALMRAACNDYIENKGSELEAPDVLTTPAGGQFDRSVDALLHVAAPYWRDRADVDNKQALLEVYANCLRFADERLGLESISFPVIGEDIFPVDVCIESFFDSLLVYIGEHTSSSPPRLTSIQLVTPSATVARFAADFILPRLNESKGGSGRLTPDSRSLSPHNDLSRRGSGEESGSTKPADLNERDRAPSGRLRVKRPRL